MKLILVDDQQNVKMLPVIPDANYSTKHHFTMCTTCHDNVLAEHTTHCICHSCIGKSIEHIEAKGWTWESPPGYFQKNFGDRITVIAGNCEYRLDFTFCSSDFDLGYGPDMCIEVGDWDKCRQELRERGCFGPEELEELEMVYEWLYADMMRDKSFGDWTLDSGGLSCPSGCRIDNESFETEPFYITQEMIWGVGCADELTNKQHRQFAELQNLIMTWLDNSVE